MMTRNLLLTLITTSAALAANPGNDAVPLFFIANHGQAPPQVRFMAQGSGLTAYFSSGEALFRMGNTSVRMQFIEASSAVELQGVEPLSGRANFLTGPEEAWRRDVPLYGAVAYRQLYPGIDMLYGCNGRNLKSEFIVAPGADPSRIRVRYPGAGEVRIDGNGQLVIVVEGEELREQAPAIYQERDGSRVPVSGRFRLAPGGAVGFVVGDYDRSRPLVIDPVLSFSTLLGGASSDAATALAVDSTGAAYLAGFTASYDFPAANSEQNFNAGSNDAFVAKLNPSGNGLVYCTYLGGRGDDRAFGIAVDAAGSAYVTGSTASSNFPLRNALQTRLAGGKNAFVLKLNPAGNTLVFSTFLGGNASDIGNGIALDGSLNVYVVGDTTSTTFPASGMQKGNRGGQDAFVAKLSADGSRLVYSTYLGGASDDHGAAIAVDAGGSAYVTGSTYSADFPVANAWQGTIAGGQDAFVAKLSADGASLLFGTFLGGSGGALGYPEAGQGIALDGQGNAYVAGVTSSSNFPLLHPLQASRIGSSPDAFVTKLTSTGALSYSTYLGGSGMDAANAIAVDAGGSAYVVGQTFSNDLPVINSYQAASGGDYDAFWAKLSPTGDSLVSLSYLGGAGSDTATAVALDPAGNIYIAGWTLSANFPVVNGFQSINAGNYGSFVAKVAVGTSPVAIGVTPSSGTGASQTFTLQFSDNAGASNLTTVSVLFNSSQTTPNGCLVTYTRAANTLALFTDAGTDPGSSITPGSGSQQNSQCTLNGAGSSVSLAGNVLTLNLAIAFQGAFAGARNVYLQATSPSGLSGWQQRGSWTVPAGPPVTVSVTPNSGSGNSQTFSFVFSDGKGYAAISSASIMINGSLSGAGGCSLVYYSSGVVYLANDANSGWLGPVTVGQSGSLQNSQCTLNAGSSSASGSGANLTLNLALTFQTGFSGARNIYMEVTDGNDSGWQLRGSWTVLAAPPVPVSVTPNSGSGNSQTFSFVFSDGKGYAAISSAATIINGSLSGVGGCFLQYYSSSNIIYLANDASTGWLGPVTVGQSGSLQNSQCTLNAGSSSASGSGANLTLNLALTFQAAFGGARNIYMEVTDGSDSGWQLRGSWTVQANGAVPTIGLLTPTSVMAGTPGMILTVNGTGFVSGSVVKWNNVNRQTTFQNGALQATITAADIAMVGSVTVTVSNPDGSTSSASPFPITPPTIWSSSTVPGNPWIHDPNALSLGVKFRSDVSGSVTGIRFYKGSNQNNGPHTGMLYTSAGALLAQATFTGESGSGWQQVTFSSPVAIAANTTYVAAYFTTTGCAYDGGYFDSRSVDNAPLHALRSGVDGPDGVCAVGPNPQFPGNNCDANYWVDIVFSFNQPSQPSPTITTLSPSSARAGTAAFTLTVNGTGFNGNSSVSWNGSARTITSSSATQLMVAITSADIATAGTATVMVTNPAPGGGTSGGANFAITTSIWNSSAVPGFPWIHDTNGLSLGVKFRSDVSGSVTGIRFYKGSDQNSGTHTGMLYTSAGALLAQATFTETSSGWQQVNFSGPVAITANTTYVAAYFTTTGCAYDSAFFDINGVDNAPLHALKSGVDGPNGVCIVGPNPQFPPYGCEANYWVDVAFTPGQSLSPNAAPSASLLAPSSQWQRR